MIGSRPDRLEARYFAALLLFLPLGLPAGLLAVVAVMLGCLAQMLAAAAGWLIELFDRATHKPDESIVVDLSPGPAPPSATLEFSEGQFRIINAMIAKQARDTQRRQMRH